KQYKHIEALTKHLNSSFSDQQKCINTIIKIANAEHVSIFNN
ncbi:9459_t:CDS:1, partial [Gigaspora rosea]